MAEMSFAEHNNMVKTIPPDRTDNPLRISVLPWRPWRDRPIPYAHCAKPLDDNISIDAIPIANDISWRLLPTVTLVDRASLSQCVGPQRLALRRFLDFLRDAPVL
jgi:hypothetical protein